MRQCLENGRLLYFLPSKCNKGACSTLATNKMARVAKRDLTGRAPRGPIATHIEQLSRRVELEGPAWVLSKINGVDASGVSPGNMLNAYGVNLAEFWLAGDCL
jgi:hypothetical protein